MKLDKEYVNAKGHHFTAHAIEAGDFVGTLHDDRGARRHILPGNEAAEWSETGFPMVVSVVEEAPAAEVIPLKVTTEYGGPTE